MVRILPRHIRTQLRERPAKIDADHFWEFLAKHQNGMAKALEELHVQAKLEAQLQNMIKPYRHWAGAQRRKPNDIKNDATNKNNNNDNTDKGTDKGSGKGFTVVQNNNNNNNKGKGKGNGAGSVPYPASKGKSKGKGKGASFLGDVSFEDAHIPMMQGFTNGQGKPVTQTHTNNASMDMDLNVYLGDAATTMTRGMKSRTVGPSAAIVQGSMPALIAHDTEGLLRARLRPKEIQLPVSKDQKSLPKNVT